MSHVINQTTTFLCSLVLVVLKRLMIDIDAKENGFDSKANSGERKDTRFTMRSI